MEVNGRGPEPEARGLKPARVPIRHNGLDEIPMAAPHADPLPDIAGLERAELESLLDAHGIEPYRAGQLFRWVFKRGVTDFALMTDLSKPLRASLPAPQRLVVSGSSAGGYGSLLAHDLARYYDGKIDPYRDWYPLGASTAFAAPRDGRAPSISSSRSSSGVRRTSRTWGSTRARAVSAMSSSGATCQRLHRSTRSRA